MGDAGAIKAGETFVEVLTKDSTKKELTRIGNRFKAWGAGLAAVGGTIAASAGGILTAMAAAVNRFNQVGSDLTDMSGRTGVAAADLSELGYAAEQTGAGLSDLEAALRTMARKTGKGGIENFLKTADAISKIEDPGKRAQAAMEAFGKSGTKLLPMLEGGAAGIQKMREEARRMGLTLTNEDAAAADKLGDAIGLLTGTFKGMVLQVGAAVAPLVQFAVDALQPIATTIVRVIKENRGLVQAFAVAAAVAGVVGTALVGVGVALIGIGGLLAALPAIAAGLATAVATLGTIFAAVFSPVGLLIGAALAAVVALAAGVAALVYWFFTATSAGQTLGGVLMATFQRIGQFFQQTFQGIFDALASGDLKLAGEVAMTALFLAWQTGVGQIKNLWADLSHFLVQAILDALGRVSGTLDSIVANVLSKVNWLRQKIGLEALGDLPKTGDLLAAARTANDARRDNLKAGASGGVALAKLAFDEAVRKAAEARKKTDDKAKLPQAQLPQVAEDLRAASSAAGTFSGFAAGRLGQAGGSAVLEELKKITEATERTADATEENTSPENGA